MQKLNKKSIKKYARLSDFIYKQSGITIVALVITIIVMMILVGVTVTVAISGKVFDNTKESVDEYDKAKDIEQIGLAYLLKFQTERESFNTENKTNEELFEDVKNSLDFEGATYNIVSEFMNIVKKDGTQYTLLADGTIKEGKIAHLDIADGSIQLKSNGYIQGQNELVEYKGKYIITGTTTENTVKVMDEGTYDITIKDLNIDVSSISGTCAFDANAGRMPSGCYVNLTLDGKNFLCSNAMAGLSFCRKNTVVENNKSTLTIKGNGDLDTRCIAGYDGAGIGGNYNPSAIVGDIIIESGNITAIGKGNACGIGGGLRQDVDNIIINGGNIIAKAGNRCGIGAAGKVNYIEINGGNITANGGEYGGPIGGSTGSGEIIITGGSIISNAYKAGAAYSFGENCSSIKIEGGTIICNSVKGIGIGSMDITKNIEINGGNIIITAGNNNFSINPTSGEDNVYLTKIQLPNITEEIQITNLITSDNIKYGIKDMYTTKDDENTVDINEGGMLYLYLPLGTRTITVQAGGNIYSGTVETKEDASVVVLNKQ